MENYILALLMQELRFGYLFAVFIFAVTRLGFSFFFNFFLSFLFIVWFFSRILAVLTPVQCMVNVFSVLYTFVFCILYGKWNCKCLHIAFHNLYVLLYIISHRPSISSTQSEKLLHCIVVTYNLTWQQNEIMIVYFWNYAINLAIKSNINFLIKLSSYKYNNIFVVRFFVCVRSLDEKNAY